MSVGCFWFIIFIYLFFLLFYTVRPIKCTVGQKSDIVFLGSEAQEFGNHCVRVCMAVSLCVRV